MRLKLGLLFGVLLRHCTVSSQEEREGFENAVVASDKIECSRAGRDILLVKGSAVDAAIATLLCLSVTVPESMGLGGGFFMTIYNKKTNTVDVLDARETAPAKAYRTMYKGLAPDASTVGGLATAVPGFINGIAEAHRKYGVLKWSQLFDAAINISRHGFFVEHHLELAINESIENINKFKILRNLLWNNEEQRFLRKGDIMKNLKLSNTLLDLAKDGPSIYYNGFLGKRLLRDLKNAGGIITETDLLNYRPRWLQPVQTSMPDSLTLNTFPLPGSGGLLAFMLNIMKQYQYDLNPPKTTEENVLFYHRAIETFKFAYARRMGLEDSDEPSVKRLTQRLISEDYAKYIHSKILDNQTFDDPAYYKYEESIDQRRFRDHGTSHLSVVAENGDAVGATSTINLFFGNFVVSPSTGILLNNEMDDFSSPDTTVNNIYPGRRPFSSMVPTIFIDKDHKPKLVIGASGSQKITTAVALVSMENLWFGKHIAEAIAEPRLHDQFKPFITDAESAFPKDIKKGLEELGHILTDLKKMDSGVDGVAREDDGLLYGGTDPRKNGGVAGY